MTLKSFVTVDLGGVGVLGLVLVALVQVSVKVQLKKKFEKRSSLFNFGIPIK